MAMKFRVAAAPETRGNYILSALLTATIPTGICSMHTVPPPQRAGGTMHGIKCAPRMLPDEALQKLAEMIRRRV